MRKVKKLDSNSFMHAINPIHSMAYDSEKHRDIRILNTENAFQTYVILSSS